MYYDLFVFLDSSAAGYLVLPDFDMKSDEIGLNLVHGADFQKGGLQQSQKIQKPILS